MWKKTLLNNSQRAVTCRILNHSLTALKNEESVNQTHVLIQNRAFVKSCVWFHCFNISSQYNSSSYAFFSYKHEGRQDEIAARESDSEKSGSLKNWLSEWELWIPRALKIFFLNSTSTQGSETCHVLQRKESALELSRGRETPATSSSPPLPSTYTKSRHLPSRQNNTRRPSGMSSVESRLHTTETNPSLK